MSKNPAWGTYNDTVRKVNADYDATMKPLRVELSNDIAEIEARLDKKINPLLLEKRNAIEGLKENFKTESAKANEKRNSDIKRARVVLDAEIKDRKAEPETAPA